MPDVPSSSRLPVLDGVRAVAISLVVGEHALHIVVGIGFFGVTIFLALSGYLITRVLMDDEEQNGTLRFGRFYLRRAWRILPALYVFLGAVALLSAFGSIPAIGRGEWLASCFYFRNLWPGHFQTGHLWSLSLEEQFYLCWPLLFHLTRRFRLGAIAGIVVLMTVGRMLWFHSHPVDFGLMSLPYLRMDTFLIGGAFAIGRWSWPRQVPAAFILAALIVWTPMLGCWWLAAMATPVSAFLTSTLICWLIGNPTAGVARALARPWPVLLGAISYSLYLWQQLFFAGPLHWWTFPGLALVVAASYLWVEKPLLRLRAMPQRQNDHSSEALDLKEYAR